MSLRTTSLLGALAIALSACTFDEHANPARGCDEQCAPGSCYLGYCLQKLDAPSAGAQSGASGAVTAPPGSSGTAADGSGTAGSTAGSSATTSGGSGTGAPPTSGSGGTTTTTGCASNMPMVESCNGVDDDCDGTIDEDASVSCYPSGVVGCTLDAVGAYTCAGLCAPGTQACVNGSLGPCEGAVQPTAEQCGGTEAADEDCDGAVDNDCPCEGSATQRCYSGRAFSAGVGVCKAGTQRCMNGVFGACEGEVTPTPETCANQGHDDDCDFFVDDVPGAGATCFDWTQLGVCGVGQRLCSGGALVCATPDPKASESSCDGQDEDCDGSVDEDFDLQRDPNHCGGCDVRCGSGQACCGGGCHDLKTDAQNCGTCGHKCGSNSACCGGACVANNTVMHCGGCSACTGGQACCGGGCVPTDTSEHCGGCGACDADQLCCGGDCVGASGDAGLSCP